jgi:TATA-box binding protein (TBP) (component of TFIID and TFIIIB)
LSKTDEARKTIKIENVVASTAIGQEIDLKKLTIAMEGADYDLKGSRAWCTGPRTRRLPR